MEFSRQEYWSGLPFPSPGDLSDPGIKPRSLALWADALPSEPPGRVVMKTAKQISYDLSRVEPKKKKNKQIKNKRKADTENKQVVAKREGGGGGQNRCRGFRDTNL